MSSSARPWPAPAERPRVRLVSPAGPVEPDYVERAIAELNAAGCAVTSGRHVLDRRGFLAGEDADRLSDLHEAFTDPTVDVVLTVRGGYGSARLLDKLDRDLLAGSTAMLVGFSDITAVHVVLAQHCRRPSIYGSGAAEGGANPLLALLRNPQGWSLQARPEEPTSSLSHGGGVGVLLGGNLTLLASLAGTRDALRPPVGAWLLLEDVREAPYRIDRMLLQLARSGAFDGIGGVVLGQFTDCQGRAGEPDVVDVLADWCDRLGVPVLGGMPVGHGPEQQLVPLGLAVHVGDGRMSLHRPTQP